jgi:hypothetical protein
MQRAGGTGHSERRSEWRGLGKPRHVREDRRLSEREVREIKSRGMAQCELLRDPTTLSASAGSAQDDRWLYFAEASALFSRALRRLAAFL